MHGGGGYIILTIFLFRNSNVTHIYV
jgi:hypothetical protein